MPLLVKSILNTYFRYSCRLYRNGVSGAKKQMLRMDDPTGTLLDSVKNTCINGEWTVNIKDYKCLSMLNSTNIFAMYDILSQM